MNDKLFRLSTVDHVTTTVAGVATTSTTPVKVETGLKSFQVATVFPWPVGLTVRASSLSNAGKYVEGTITAFSGSSCEINVTSTGILTVTVTRLGSTATANCASHGFVNGDNIIIAGAVQPEYNGTFTIFNAGTNTFDYTITGTPAFPATGSITANPTAIADWSVVPTGSYQPSAQAGTLIEISIPRENKFRWIWSFYDNASFLATPDAMWIQLFNDGQLVTELPGMIITNDTPKTRLGISNYPNGLTGLPQANVASGATNIGGPGVIWWNNASGQLAEFAIQPFRVVAEADTARMWTNKAGNTRALLAILSTEQAP